MTDSPETKAFGVTNVHEIMLTNAKKKRNLFFRRGNLEGEYVEIMSLLEPILLLRRKLLNYLSSVALLSDSDSFLSWRKRRSSERRNDVNGFSYSPKPRRDLSSFVIQHNRSKNTGCALLREINFPSSLKIGL